MTYHKPTDEQLRNRFTHHAPTSVVQVEKYTTIREKALEFAFLIRDAAPCSAEMVRALNALDEVMFLANAAIARHPEE